MSLLLNVKREKDREREKERERERERLAMTDKDEWSLIILLTFVTLWENV